MNLNIGRFLQAMILTVFVVLLLKLLWTGEIRKLVAPHITLLLQISTGVLIIMAIYVWMNVKTKDHDCSCEHDPNHSHGHDHQDKPGILWGVLLLPVILGLAVPTQSLGTAMLNSGMNPKPANVKTVDLASVPRVKVEGMPLPPKPEPGSEVTMYEVMNNILIAPEHYFNQRYRYIGFVYHPVGWPENRMILVRYVMVHCAADVLAVGLTVEAQDAGKYPNDTWVEVDATLSTRKAPEIDEEVPVSWYYGYEEKPVLVAHEIKIIEEPKDPYIYPFGFNPAGGN
ncbi:hypothetical protein [Effusibacillus lacus]|uniref:TIGR03943 family protein n=1 Tax=Effusibacillus lacus TaxID=1348429 RepID=A0A292YN90_9BACL|nr:hypothetical protein [Effusibacillus lacus]